tara:strand:+ start:426 stop:614 length:189 start_codon:yes stop_codon:yes gene_type:complete
MPDIPAPVRDTACFSDKQWFVGDIPFSTKGDAENATKLAGQHGYKCMSEVAKKIADFVDTLY